LNKAIAHSITFRQVIRSKMTDYAQLTKLRLSFLVVFSAVASYLFLATGTVLVADVILLAIAGWMVTAASNALNQVLEKNEDMLMNRTNDRPVTTGRMSVTEAILLAGVLGTSGIALLGFHFNAISGLLGALALISYAFIYTPFKKISSFAVLVGAVPGAVPLLIGGTAANGEITVMALVLFAIQFFWQMPHFWSIAWLMKEDYAKAGFRLLPGTGEKERMVAMQNIPFLVILLGVGTLPYLLNASGLISMIVIALTGLYFLKSGVQLVKDLSDKSARNLMFASFAYIPISLLALVIDKI